MLQAMYNGVSSLEAHQKRINVIGNNIANVNTTGYKAERVTFQDQLSQTIQGASKGDGVNVGGTNPIQLGLGVKVGSIDILTEQGGLQSTSRPPDLAVQGNGYFMLSDSGGTKYTRDGSFSIDSKGDLVSAAGGSYVLGWKADAKGNIDNSKQIDMSSHLSIPIGGLTLTSPTDTVTYAGNLSAEATAASPAYSRNVKVYDSLGEPQSVTLSFTRQPNSNVWDWTASGPSVAAGSSGTITFDGSGTRTANTGAITLNPTNGANKPQTITPDFSQVVQVSGSSTLAPSGQNGFAPGSLQSFAIDQAGIVTGIFNNGYTRTLGQIALTGFANPTGLEKAGSNSYRATVNSGLPQVGTATAGGLGQISTGYLEQSNVDLSNEFTSMIVTQRGFQANTKIITTVDQLLDDVINLKR